MTAPESRRCVDIVADAMAAERDDILSNVTINGERQTWQQLYEREKAERVRLEGYARMLCDLDRNEHGRHQGDIDGCSPSQGNPHLKTGDVIGYALGGSWKYVVPEPQLRGNLDAWRVHAEVDR